MTFPVVATVNYSEETIDTTTHDVLVPASISAGDLLMLWAGIDGNTITQPTVTGWTNLFWLNGAGTVSMGVWYKFAAGGESAFTYTTSVAEQSANRTWRVTGAHPSAAPEVSAGGANGNGSIFNPATITPSWGADDNLFVVFAAYSAGTITVSSYPTNYTDNQFSEDTTGSTNSGGVTICSRNVNTATEDPDNLTWSTAIDRIGRTFAIRPGGAGGGGASTDPYGMRGFFGG